MATPQNVQKIDPDGKASAAASTAAPAPATATATTAATAADDDDEKPAQSFEGPEKVLEIWWTEVPLTGKALGTASADPKEAAYNRTGLRTIAVDKLKKLLTEVKCCILSSVSNAHVDAYLLSESSMFVYPFQIVLKTCGTTTLLNAIDPLLALARDECGLTDLNNVFYCRKNFRDPTKQLYPHTSWDEECAVLGRVFQGEGHVMGRTTGDHWYLYTTDNTETVSILSPTYAKQQTAATAAGTVVAAAPLTALPAAVKPAAADAKAPAAAAVAPAAAAAPAVVAPVSLEAALASCTNTQRKQLAEHLTKLLGKPVAAGVNSPTLRPVGLPATAGAGGGAVAVPLSPAAAKGDQTLELLMSELDQTKMKVFTKVPHLTDADVTRLSGIGALYPDALVDAFVFDPQGYSMNGIRGAGYYTIHITPQPNCSYASFETNIAQDDGDYTRLIQQNLDIFGPAKFTLIFFTTAPTAAAVGGGGPNAHAAALVAPATSVLSGHFGEFAGYARSGMHVCPFATYTVTYCHYSSSATTAKR